VSRLNDALARHWLRVGTRLLPFADAATAELPLGRLLRLSLFQVSVGMALVLLNGTLNRVMIVELGVPTWLVALMVALPLVFAPFRALVGFRSDHRRSPLGWRRVPYLWMGTLLQFGGFAIMPFALLVLSGDTHGPIWIGQAGAAIAFLLVGAGMHTTQTAGLALAADLAPAESRPRVVALLYVMLLLGTVGSALLFGFLLSDFRQVRLIQVIQGAGAATMVLNLIALWKQEARNPERMSNRRREVESRPDFRAAWRSFVAQPNVLRFLVATALGTAAFGMQDILLEPYGGQILGLGVGATTTLTALMAGGTLAAFALAARGLGRGADPYRLAGMGGLVGLAAFASVILAAPFDSPLLFRVGAALIGFGAGLFSVGTLTVAMGLDTGGLDDGGGQRGLALGVWGAVQATAAGSAIALGGLIRDGASALAARELLGPALTGPATGYGVVYHLELLLLFAMLVAIGPLVRVRSGGRHAPHVPQARFGLAEFPG
jgi:BCD family chlorophyll transporter-like MFS transporter